jgi:hypothetical protein
MVFPSIPRVAPPAPPNTPKSCRTDQGPNRDAPTTARPEQTGPEQTELQQHAALQWQPTGSPLADTTNRSILSDPATKSNA